MSTKQDNNASTEKSPVVPEAMSENLNPINEIVFNKRTGEMSLTSPKGEKILIKTSVVEEEDNEFQPEPLGVAEFNFALTRLDELGFTWSADNPPMIRAKTGVEEAVFGSDEFFHLQDQFPSLPREIGIVVSFAIMGNTPLADIVGGQEVLDAKVKIVNDLFVTHAFRSEFFFKHAIKVPYLSEIDWEIVMKMHEKGVSAFPGVSYGILSLLLREPSSFGFASKREVITVAVNKSAIERFITIFEEIRDCLESSEKITDKWHKQQQRSYHDD